jgi:hypothetical protein
MFDFTTHWSEVLDFIRGEAAEEKLIKAYDMISKESRIPPYAVNHDYPICLFLDANEPKTATKLNFLLGKVGFFEEPVPLDTDGEPLLETEAIVLHWKRTQDNPWWWVYPSKHWQAFMRFVATQLVPNIDWMMYRLCSNTVTVSDPHCCYVFDLLEWLRLKREVEPAQLSPGLAYDMFVQEDPAFSSGVPIEKLYDEANFFSPIAIFQERFVPHFSRQLEQAQARQFQSDFLSTTL